MTELGMRISCIEFCMVNHIFNSFEWSISCSVINIDSIQFELETRSKFGIEANNHWSNPPFFVFICPSNRKSLIIERNCLEPVVATSISTYISALLFLRFFAWWVLSSKDIVICLRIFLRFRILILICLRRLKTQWFPTHCVFGRSNWRSNWRSKCWLRLIFLINISNLHTDTLRHSRDLWLFRNAYNSQSIGILIFKFVRFFEILFFGFGYFLIDDKVDLTNVKNSFGLL